MTKKTRYSIFSMIFLIVFSGCISRYIKMMDRYSDISERGYSENRHLSSDSAKIELITDMKLTLRYCRKVIDSEPRIKRAYMIYLQTSFKLSEIDELNSNAHYRNAYEVSSLFYSEFPDDIMASYWFINCIYACEFVDKFIVNDAITAGHRLLLNKKFGEEYSLYKKQIQEIVKQLEEVYNEKREEIQE